MQQTKWSMVRMAMYIPLDVAPFVSTFHQVAYALEKKRVSSLTTLIVNRRELSQRLALSCSASKLVLQL